MTGTQQEHASRVPTPGPAAWLLPPSSLSLRRGRHCPAPRPSTSQALGGGGGVSTFRMQAPSPPLTTARPYPHARFREGNSLAQGHGTREGARTRTGTARLESALATPQDAAQPTRGPLSPRPGPLSFPDSGSRPRPGSRGDVSSHGTAAPGAWLWRGRSPGKARGRPPGARAREPPERTTPAPYPEVASGRRWRSGGGSGTVTAQVGKGTRPVARAATPFPLLRQGDASPGPQRPVPHTSALCREARRPCPWPRGLRTALPGEEFLVFNKYVPGAPKGSKRRLGV